MQAVKIVGYKVSFLKLCHWRKKMKVLLHSDVGMWHCGAHPKVSKIDCTIENAFIIIS
jgi:hypothetical protein